MAWFVTRTAYTGGLSGVKGAPGPARWPGRRRKKRRQRLLAGNIGLRKLSQRSPAGDTAIRKFPHHRFGPFPPRAEISARRPNTREGLAETSASSSSPQESRSESSEPVPWRLECHAQRSARQDSALEAYAGGLAAVSLTLSYSCLTNKSPSAGVPAILRGGIGR